MWMIYSPGEAGRCPPCGPILLKVVSGASLYLEFLALERFAIKTSLQTWAYPGGHDSSLWECKGWPSHASSKRKVPDPSARSDVQKLLRYSLQQLSWMSWSWDGASVKIVSIIGTSPCLGWEIFKSCLSSIWCWCMNSHVVYIRDGVAKGWYIL